MSTRFVLVLLAVALIFGAVFVGLGRSPGGAAVAPLPGQAEPGPVETPPLVEPGVLPAFQQERPMGATRARPRDEPVEAESTPGRRPPGGRRLFCGRVLRAEDASAVSNATIHLAPTTERIQDVLTIHAVTGPDGFFSVSVPASEPYYGCVRADGYAPALFGVASGHAVPDEALTILLRRAAGIEGRVTDARGGALRSTVTIVVVVDTGYPLDRTPLEPAFDWGKVGGLEWRSHSGPDGGFAFADLPPYTRLTVGFVIGEERQRRERRSLTLLPGEVREVEWRLYGGASVTGMVLDERGEPQPGRDVLFAPWPHGVAIGTLHLGDPPVSHWSGATSDEEGRFELLDLDDGTFLVKYDRHHAAEVPIGVPVHVATGEDRVEIELIVRTGRPIRGRALEEDGRPAARVRIVASSKAEEWSISETTDDRGTFSFDPVPDGEYELLCPDREAEGAAVARAGDQDVVLRLRRPE